MLVQTPQTSFETGPLEVAQHAPAPVGIERPFHDVVQQHVLRGEHGTPNHLTFPGPIIALETQQALACTPQRRAGIG